MSSKASRHDAKTRPPPCEESMLRMPAESSTVPCASKANTEARAHTANIGERLDHTCTQPHGGRQHHPWVLRQTCSHRGVLYGVTCCTAVPTSSKHRRTAHKTPTCTPACTAPPSKQDKPKPHQHKRSHSALCQAYTTNKQLLNSTAATCRCRRYCIHQQAPKHDPTHTVY